MPGFTTRAITANGIRLVFRDEGSGPAVVLYHGFPELAYSWRHQVRALAAAGFRVLAPDQRGYGDSDRPDDVAAYDVHHLAGDLVGLLDALDIERAVFVGHDWGGLVGWMMPLLHPARTAGVVGVNTPYLPRAPMAPIAVLRAAFGDTHYMVHFQQPGEADAALARDVRRVFTQLMRRGVAPEEASARLAAWGRMLTMVEMVEAPESLGASLLSEEDLAVYVDAFSRTGFTGGINWYRNMDRNWETTPALDGARITVPSLMVVAEWDMALPPALAEPMRSLVDDLELATIPQCGHWTPQEQPEALNRILADWLGRRFGAGGAAG
jgi:pimeloyl-ACP methyl ester carboxylesterase